MAYFRCNQIALIDKTASGAVASFSDGIGGVPFTDITAEIVPLQDGTGDPGPENKRPLHGFTGGNIVRAGKNLYNDDSTKYTKPFNYYICPLILKNGSYRLSARLKPGKTALSGYTVGITGSGANYETFTPKIFVVSTSGAVSEYNVTVNDTWTAPKLIIFAPNDGSVADIFETYELQLETGSTTTSYEKYVAEVFPVTWQTEAGEIFGGTINIVTGVLTVTNGVAVYDGSESGWSYNAANLGFIRTVESMKSGNAQAGLCDTFKTISSNGAFGVRFGGNNQILYFNHITDNISEVTDLATWLSWLSTNNVTVIYPLATPQIYQLSKTEVLALLGVNNVFNDTNGNTEVTYKAKP